MTYREQRRGQVATLHVMAFLWALMVMVGGTWWLFGYAALCWEIFLWAIRKHYCWRDDIDLDARVPLDGNGRPLH
jgi:hypothetical protein